jgi:hypothetical protein
MATPELTYDDAIALTDAELDERIKGAITGKP